MRPVLLEVSSQQNLHESLILKLLLPGGPEKWADHTRIRKNLRANSEIESYNFASLKKTDRFGSVYFNTFKGLFFF